MWIHIFKQLPKAIYKHRRSLCARVCVQVSLHTYGVVKVYTQLHMQHLIYSKKRVLRSKMERKEVLWPNTRLFESVRKLLLTSMLQGVIPMVPTTSCCLRCEGKEGCRQTQPLPPVPQSDQLSSGRASHPAAPPATLLHTALCSPHCKNTLCTQTHLCRHGNLKRLLHTRFFLHHKHLRETTWGIPEHLPWASQGTWSQA